MANRLTPYSPRYRLPQEVLHFRRWADEVVVYDRRFGDTHLTSAAAARVLDRLRQGPADVAELACVVASEPGDGDQGTRIQETEQILGSLQQLDLVERESPP